MATTYYVDGDVGVDATNSGSSEGANPLTSGVGAATTNLSIVIDLSADSPDLSGVSVGDTIRIAGRIDGLRTGELFRIVAVDDVAKTVDVHTATLSTTSGIVWAIGGAFKTIQKSIDELEGPGSKCWIKASATYTETVVVGAFGTATDYVVLEGYTTTPGDLGLALIDGEGVRATCFNAASGSAFFALKNLEATGSTTSGFGLVSDDSVTYKRCRAYSNGTVGFLGDNINQFIDCYAHDNGTHGFQLGGAVMMLNCASMNNANHGMFVDGGSLWNCFLLGNGSDGIRKNTVGDDISVIDCTVIGMGKTTDAGLYITSGNSISVIGCIIYDCVTGITGGGGFDGEHVESQNNCLFLNTTNYTDFETHSGEILADPLFVDSAAGDYSLRDNSPCRNTGKHVGNLPWIIGPFKGDRAYIGALPPTPTDAVTTARFSPGLHINGDLG